jgi:hypothetical protein
VFITDRKGGCSAKSPVALFQEEVLAENTFLSTPLILPRGYSLFIASNYFGDYFFEHNV